MFVYVCGCSLLLVGLCRCVLPFVIVCWLFVVCCCLLLFGVGLFWFVVVCCSVFVVRWLFIGCLLVVRWCLLLGVPLFCYALFFCVLDCCCCAVVCRCLLLFVGVCCCFGVVCCCWLLSVVPLLSCVVCFLFVTACFPHACRVCVVVCCCFFSCFLFCPLLFVV